jgi:hypothetical protein
MSTETNPRILVIPREERRNEIGRFLIILVVIFPSLQLLLNPSQEDNKEIAPSLAASKYPILEIWAPASKSHFSDKEIAIFLPQKATFSDKPLVEFSGA